MIENSYLNNVQSKKGKVWLSHGWNGLNGRADFCNENSPNDRWNKHFNDGRLLDYSDGDYILIPLQIKNDMSIQGRGFQYQTIVNEIRNPTPRDGGGDGERDTTEIQMDILEAKRQLSRGTFTGEAKAWRNNFVSLLRELELSQGKEPSSVESLAAEALREYNTNVTLGKVKQKGASTTGLEGYALEGESYSKK